MAISLSGTVQGAQAAQAPALHRSVSCCRGSNAGRHDTGSSCTGMNDVSTTLSKQQ